MGHNMLKWLVIEPLNKVALCLYKSELYFKVIERKYNMATHENLWQWFDCHKQRFMQKYRKLYPDSDDTLNS